MKNYLIIVLILVSGLLTGCATTQNDEAKFPLDSDPRVGEEVQQACFIRDLDGWQSVDNDRKAVILRMNNGDTFKLKLIGACAPSFADLNLAFESGHGSSCFSPGDKVKTDGDLSRGNGAGCKVTSIHKWDAQAVSKTETAEQ